MSLDRESELKAARERHKKWIDEARMSWAAYAKRPQRLNFGTKPSGLWWSVVETMRPHYYFQRPPIYIQRRVDKKDLINNRAAYLAEVATEYMLDTQPFDQVIEAVVLDFILTGRGVPWVLYEPTIKDVNIYAQRTEDPNSAILEGEIYPVSEFRVDSKGLLYITRKQLTNERILVTRIHPQDYLEGEGRQPEEVEWRARRVHISEEVAKERFGSEIAKTLNYTAGRSDASMTREPLKESAEYAAILEVYDREQGVVCYYDETDRKIEKFGTDKPIIDFEGFFPCPTPLISSTTGSDLEPVSDYFQIRSDLETLDVLQRRRHALAEKIQITGAYNGAFGAMFKAILESGRDTFVPVKDWPTFASAQGFSGNLQIFPFGEVANALTVISGEIAAVKQNIYETLGASDLLRGVNDPRATAAAEELKGDYASTRLAERRKMVARMVRDTIRLVAEATVEKINSQRFLEMTGMSLISTAPSGPEFQKQLGEMQLTQQAYVVLRDDKLRTFALEIETESTIKSDERKDKEAAIEFMGQFQGALAAFTNALQTAPWAAEPLKEATMMLLRKFKAGRGVEEKIEQSLESAIEQQKQAAQQPPQPDPMQQVLQAQMQAEQTKAQAAIQRVQVEAQKAQVDAQKQALELQQKAATLEQKERELQQKEAALLLQAEETQARVEKIRAETNKVQQDVIIDAREQKRRETETVHDIQTSGYPMG